MQETNVKTNGVKRNRITESFKLDSGHHLQDDAESDGAWSCSVCLNCLKNRLKDLRHHTACCSARQTNRSADQTTKRP